MQLNDGFKWHHGLVVGGGFSLTSGLKQLSPSALDVEFETSNNILKRAGYFCKVGYIGKIKKKGTFMQYDLSYLYSVNKLGSYYYDDEYSDTKVVQRQISLSFIGGLYRQLTKKTILFGGAGGFVNTSFSLKDLETDYSLTKTSLVNYGVSFVMGLEFPYVSIGNLFQTSVFYDIGLKNMASFKHGIRTRGIGVAVAYFW